MAIGHLLGQSRPCFGQVCSRNYTGPMTVTSSEYRASRPSAVKSLAGWFIACAIPALIPFERRQHLLWQPAGAHLFVLPNKNGLDSARYFSVQGIYRGWSMFGFILFGCSRGQPCPAAPAAPPSCALCAGLGRFFCPSPRRLRSS
jgi:hypothetical protein